MMPPLPEVSMPWITSSTERPPPPLDSAYSRSWRSPSRDWSSPMSPSPASLSPAKFGVEPVSTSRRLKPEPTRSICDHGTCLTASSLRVFFFFAPLAIGASLQTGRSGRGQRCMGPQRRGCNTSEHARPPRSASPRAPGGQGPGGRARRALLVPDLSSVGPLELRDHSRRIGGRGRRGGGDGGHPPRQTPLLPPPRPL